MAAANRPLSRKLHIAELRHGILCCLFLAGACPTVGCSDDLGIFKVGKYQWSCSKNADCGSGWFCYCDHLNAAGALDCDTTGTSEDESRNPYCHPEPLQLCQPDCDGRQCGPDPTCGLSCGTCPNPNAMCDADGQCICEPQCENRLCGDDGCGGTCPPGCQAGEYCEPVARNCVACSALGDLCSADEQGHEKCVCTPDDMDTCRSASQFPLDRCEPSTENPECLVWTLVTICSVGCRDDFEDKHAECVTCIPQCDQRECGSDGCGGSCGDCQAKLEACNDSGRCVGVMTSLTTDSWAVIGTHLFQDGQVTPQICDTYPEHSVNLATFQMDRYEVTNERFVRFLEAMVADGTAQIDAGGDLLAGTRVLYRCHDESSGSGIECVPGDAGTVSFAIRQTCQQNGADPASLGSCAQHPVSQVGFWGANAYCEWAGKRLCTEAEWERGCEGQRGYGITGYGSRYPWGDNWPSNDPDPYNRAKFTNTSESSDTTKDGFVFTAAVDQQTMGKTNRPDEEIYGMAGNVAEWVHDWYANDYYCNGDDGSSNSGCVTRPEWASCIQNPDDPTSAGGWSNPQGPCGGDVGCSGQYPLIEERVVRGGSYDSNEQEVTCNHRDRWDINVPAVHIGFRCCADEVQ